MAEEDGGGGRGCNSSEIGDGGGRNQLLREGIPSREVGGGGIRSSKRAEEGVVAGGGQIAADLKVARRRRGAASAPRSRPAAAVSSAPALSLPFPLFLCEFPRARSARWVLVALQKFLALGPDLTESSDSWLSSGD
jgi:hypothetical protein